MIRSIIDGLPVGLIVINSRGVIIISHRTAVDILGLSVSALKNRVWGELFFEEAANDAFNQVILDVIEKKKVNFHKTVPFLRPDGETLTLSLTTSFIKDEEGVVRIVVLIDDLTELERLHDRERTILEEKQRVQSERVESLRNLALAVAHQIRNPVAAIGGFALRLMRTAKAGTQTEQYLQFILDGTRRLEQVVEAVRSYAEVHDLAWQSVAAEAMVRAEVEGFLQALSEAGSSITWRRRHCLFQQRSARPLRHCKKGNNEALNRYE